MVVNANGQRFINEDTYPGRIGQAAVYHQDARAYLVFDEEAYESVPEDLRPILEQTKRRGLFFLDDGSAERSVLPEIAATAQAPAVRADSVVDRVPSREGVESELATLEIAAKTRGVAIGVATANPMTIDRITAWAATLEQKGIALAPVTAIIAAQQGSAAAQPLAPPPAPELPRPPAQELPSAPADAPH